MYACPASLSRRPTPPGAAGSWRDARRAPAHEVEAAVDRERPAWSPAVIREPRSACCRYWPFRSSSEANNGTRYLEGRDLQSVSDADVVDTIASGATGTVLTVKIFLPLLLNSDQPDVVTMVSACGTAGHHRSDAHDAFYAAKSAQAGFAEILSKRLRPQGARLISLYPPDFDNPNPLSEKWETTPREAKDPLTGQSLVECILFAVAQPRDCFIKAVHFEQV